MALQSNGTAANGSRVYPSYLNGYTAWSYYNAANRSEAVAYQNEAEDMYDRPHVRRAVRVKKPQTAYRLSAVKGYKLSPLLALTVVLVFLGGLLVALSFAAVSSQQVKLDQQVTSLNQQREANIQLQAEVNQNLDLKRIEDIATTKLGMVKPQDYQIVYIHVPKQSYVVAEKQPVPSQQGGGLTSLLSFLGGK